MSSLAATQSDGYYLPPEYFESGDYKKVSRNRYAAETEAASRNGGAALSRAQKKKLNVGHNQWLKHGVVRFELSEKVVCLGCRQSVGKGTRFNARKTKTDEDYRGTPVYEFQLKCRNCQQPWVIRTDPQEQGFTYVSGVKRQAGQDQNLHEDSSFSRNDVPAEGSAQRGALDALEAAAAKAAVAHHQPATKTGLVFRTELEELEAIAKLNEKSSGAGRDVDHNTSIRKAFRTDRREHRKRLVGGTALGWRKGMALLPSSSGDLLAAKETCYGRAHRDERARLSGVRRSSIFGSSSSDKKGKRKRRRQHQARSSGQEISSGSHRPEIVASSNTWNSMPPPVISGSVFESAFEDDSPRATTETPTPEPIPSLATSGGGASIPKKKTTTLRLTNGIVSVVGRGNDTSARRATSTRRMLKGKDPGSVSENPLDEPSSNPQAKNTAPKPSLLDLIGEYGSSEEEDDNGV